VHWALDSVPRVKLINTLKKLNSHKLLENPRKEGYPEYFLSIKTALTYKKS
jgi:hypothetical protein